MTLKDRVARIRAIIDLYPLDTAFSEAHLAELSDLTATELRSAWRRINPIFPNDTRHLHVLAYAWTEPNQFSWRSAAKLAGSKKPAEAVRQRQRHKRLFALRWSIRHDLHDFRAAAEPKNCWVCGSVDNLAADHHRVPFISIAEEFLKLHPQFALRSISGAGDVIADDDIEAHWITFHAQRACYQLLCRRCNSAKGAR